MRPASTKAKSAPPDLLGYLLHRIATFILTIFAVCLSIGTAYSAEKPLEHGVPNIVLILADDLGWTDVGCFGTKFYETPNIDRLAKEGMRFTNAYTNGPNCAPTRACLMSGKYSPRHGVFTVGDPWRGAKNRRKMIPVPNNTTLASEEVTIAEALKTAGYTSAAIGKWHLGGQGNLPTDQGFDLNVGGSHSGSPAGGYHLPNRMKLPKAKKGEYLTDHLTDRGVEFIEEHKNGPFFLYQSYHSVHTPIQSKKEYKEKYDKKPVPEGSKHSHAAYAGMVQSLDEGVGKILEKLDDLGIADRTVVVFMSDNGGVGGYRDAGIGGTEITNNAPLRGGKGMLYEGGIHVPMIVRWPGVVEPGSQCDVPVITTDFYPTFLAIAGAKGDPKHKLDGRSLLPLLLQTGKFARDAIYWHFPAYLQGYGGDDRTTPAGVIRSGDYKLIEFFEDGHVELYNLAEDIGEKNDLAKKMPERAKELHDKLIAWRKSVNAPMPKPNPDYNPAAKPGKKGKGKKKK